MWNPLKKIKGSPKIEDMRGAANIVSTVLNWCKLNVHTGMNLLEIEQEAQRIITGRGATSYNKGYQPRWAKSPYPAYTCLSVNQESVHTPPRDKTLRRGDVLKVDLGIRYKSGCGDAALTIIVGDDITDDRAGNPKDRILVELNRSIIREQRKLVKDGLHVNELGMFCQRMASAAHVLPITQFSGHAIGKEMHEEPLIPNWRDPNASGILREGMVICLEPMLTSSKRGNMDIKEDGWTAYQKDGSTATQFEDMVLVTKDGCELLTHHID